MSPRAIYIQDDVCRVYIPDDGGDWDNPATWTVSQRPTKERITWTGVDGLIVRGCPVFYYGERWQDIYIFEADPRQFQTIKYGIPLPVWTRLAVKALGLARAPRYPTRLNRPVSVEDRLAELRALLHEAADLFDQLQMALDGAGLNATATLAYAMKQRAREAARTGRDPKKRPVG